MDDENNKYGNVNVNYGYDNNYKDNSDNKIIMIMIM